jgi:hypothetical protein
MVARGDQRLPRVERAALFGVGRMHGASEETRCAPVEGVSVCGSAERE